jgi:hypothetical protein
MLQQKVKEEIAKSAIKKLHTLVFEKKGADGEDAAQYGDKAAIKNKGNETDKVMKKLKADYPGYKQHIKECTFNAASDNCKKVFEKRTTHVEFIKGAGIDDEGDWTFDQTGGDGYYLGTLRNIFTSKEDDGVLQMVSGRNKVKLSKASGAENPFIYADPGWTNKVKDKRDTTASVKDIDKNKLEWRKRDHSQLFTTDARENAAPVYAVFYGGKLDNADVEKWTKEFQHSYISTFLKHSINSKAKGPVAEAAKEAEKVITGLLPSGESLTKSSKDIAHSVIVKTSEKSFNGPVFTQLVDAYVAVNDRLLEILKQRPLRFNVDTSDLLALAESSKITEAQKNFSDSLLARFDQGFSGAPEKETAKQIVSKKLKDSLFTYWKLVEVDKDFFFRTFEADTPDRNSAHDLKALTEKTPASDLSAEIETKITAIGDAATNPTNAANKTKWTQLRNMLATWFPNDEYTK